DSACLAAATIVKTAGLPFDGAKQAQARAIAGGNHPGMSFNIQFAERPETRTLVSFDCTASTDVSAPAFVWNGGKFTATASATGAVGEVTPDHATRKCPALLL